MGMLNARVKLRANYTGMLNIPHSQLEGADSQPSDEESHTDKTNAGCGDIRPVRNFFSTSSLTLIGA